MSWKTILTVIVASPFALFAFFVVVHIVKPADVAIANLPRSSVGNFDEVTQQLGRTLNCGSAYDPLESGQYGRSWVCSPRDANTARLRVRESRGGRIRDIDMQWQSDWPLDPGKDRAIELVRTVAAANGLPEDDVVQQFMSRQPSMQSFEDRMHVQYHRDISYSQDVHRMTLSPTNLMSPGTRASPAAGSLGSTFRETIVENRHWCEGSVDVIDRPDRYRTATKVADVICETNDSRAAVTCRSA